MRHIAIWILSGLVGAFGVMAFRGAENHWEVSITLALGAWFFIFLLYKEKGQ